MYNIVKKTLEVYLREKRLPDQAEFSTEDFVHKNYKKAVFVTLYLENKVIASMGRIQCLKENSFAECIDLTLQCLKDPRLSQWLQTLDMLEKITIRVDVFSPENRRILKHISELNITSEGLIFLSQKLWKMSVVLPGMVKDNPTPEKILAYAQKKAAVPEVIASEDYILYGLSTEKFIN